VRHDHGPQEEGSYMYWHGPYAGGWDWAVGLGSLLFWVLIAVAIAALARSFLRGGRGPFLPYRGYGAPGPYDPPEARMGHGPVTPEQILAERYARGEIDEDEFWRRMTTLRSGRQGDASADTAS
jgi:putative membrane protein